MSYSSPFPGGYPAAGGYNNYGMGGYYSGSPMENGGGKKRYRDDDDYGGGGRGPQRRYNDSPRGRGRGRSSYGGPRRGRDDFEGAKQAAESSFCSKVWNIGNSDRFDFRSEIPSTVRAVEEQWIKDPAPVLKAFRVAAVELPHKLPHLAIVLAMLATSYPKHEEPKTQHVHTAIGVVVVPNDQPERKTDQAVPIAETIIRDLIRSFQSHLDGRRWRSCRLHLHLLAHLSSLPKPLVSSSSLIEVLNNLAGVWDEVGLTRDRGDEFVRIIAETLLRSGKMVTEECRDPKVESLHSAMVVYMKTRTLERSLYNDAPLAEQYDDPIDGLYVCLTSPSSTLTCLPTLYEAFEAELASLEEASTGPAFTVIDLPGVLVPPPEDNDSGVPTTTDAHLDVGDDADKLEMNELSHRSYKTGPVDPDSKDRVGCMGIELLLKFFVDDTVPPRNTADGCVLRSLLADIIDIFEVNRKECAKFLLQLPRWVARGTFRPKNAPAPAPDDDDNNEHDRPQSKAPGWSLENCVVESILGALLSMPSPPRKAVYYHSLITELCRLAPQAVAPSLGKCIRRLYAGVGLLEDTPDNSDNKTGGNSLDPEGIRRFASWFAVHLSNFGFSWAWNDWQPDLELPVLHPKRILISKVLSTEIRLSYFDRIKGTVPESFSQAGAIGCDAPGPTYEYGDEENAHRLAAEDITQLMRRKESTARLTQYISAMRERIQQDPINLSEVEAKNVVLDVLVQSLLNIGSRSFSHFLNILERYLELLRSLTSTTTTKLELLRIVAKFWQKNRQFLEIVIDNLIAYRVLEPINAVDWLFEGQWAELETWDVLEAVLDKVKSRVRDGELKVRTLKRRAEKKRAAEGADPSAMEDTAEGNGIHEEATTEELQAAERRLSHHHSEQKTVLIAVVEHFDKAFASSQTKEHTGDTDEKDWSHWWLVGWWKLYCRSYARTIMEYPDELANVAWTSTEAESIMKCAMARALS